MERVDCPKKEKKQKQAGAVEDALKRLKDIGKSIRKLQKSRKSEIDEARRQTIKKQNRINTKAQQIIEGTQKLDASVLQISGQIFFQNDQKISQSTQPSNNNATPIKNQGLKDYWKKVLLTQYEDCMNEEDLQVLDYLKQIAVKQYEKQKITIDFHIGPGHVDIPQGIYTRTLLRQDDQIYQYQGNAVPEYFFFDKGFMKIILISSEADKQQLNWLGQLFELLATELVPRSLQCYLAARVKEGLLGSAPRS